MKKVFLVIVALVFVVLTLPCFVNADSTGVKEGVAEATRDVKEGVQDVGSGIKEGGKEVFVIPVERPKPSKLEQCWEAGPIADSKFTEKEMAQITAMAGKDLSRAIAQFAPGWKVSKCGEDMSPGLYDEKRGKKNVLVTHPLNQSTGCVISRKLEFAANKKTTLKLVVGNDERGDWDLIIKANGRELTRKTISGETAPGGWLDVKVDLSPYAGKTIELELINQPTAWKFEAGHWAEISLESQ